MEQLSKFLEQLLNMDEVKIRKDSGGDFRITGRSLFHDFRYRSLTIENYATSYRYYMLFNDLGFQTQTTGDISIAGDISIEDGNKLIN